ncbi:hypothetical protein ACWGIN_09255 [Streptomyces sp. NPDC054861]
MRGPAAPTSPGPWDAHSEALLETKALTPLIPHPTAAWEGEGDTVAPLGAQDAPLPVLAPEDDTLPGFGAEADTLPGRGPEAGALPGLDAEADTVPLKTTATVPVNAPRRGPVDPVRVLMHRHRELCERAVDPLEIAAGLEAHGVTDRTAARFRHRDVFSLAEELYARVPRGSGAPVRPARETGARPGRSGWTVRALVPGAVATLAVGGLALTEGSVRLAVGVAGALGLAVALVIAVRRGPLRAAGRTAPAARVWTLWLLAYALGGDGLLQETLTGGPEGGWPVTPGPLLGLALAVAPAAWCAHLFSVRARHRLAASRGLEDFAAGARPLLLLAVALHTAALAALLGLTGFAPGALALGGLLLLARLLTVHGFADTAANGLAAACAGEALAVATVLAARIPGCDLLAAPVRTLVGAWGPGALPTLVCGAAAVGLLAHATVALSRASAHAHP